MGFSSQQVIGIYQQQEDIDMKNKTIAIITGASSGLGREFVRILTDRPELDEIWAIARNEQKLQALVSEFGDKIKPFSRDLSDRKQIEAFADTLANADVSIQYLINNAGFAKFCSYNDLSVEESLNMIDLNINGLVAMGLVCIPYMKKGSHLINIASQASFQPLPYQNIYSSTKAFVRNYTRALNVELRDRGIIATAVCPGWMKTNLIDNGLIGADKATSRFRMMVTPDVVAEKAIRDADHNKDISVYSLYVKTAHAFAKLLPQRLMMKIWLIQQHLS